MAEEEKDLSQMENRLPKKERWENLSLANDFIFVKAMKDPEICKEVLEALLGKKVKVVSYPEGQKVIDITAASKSIRLDVYLYGDGAAYNIEMQTTDKKNLPKRSRYYSSMIDLDILDKGMDYNSLPKSFVIFICTFDPFGKEYYRYTFRNVCEELSSLSLDDGVTKMFFNTKGVKGSISDAAQNFLNFIESNEAVDDFTKRLKDKVDSIKENKEWRLEYMTLMMEYREKYNEGRAEERAEWEEREASWTLERTALEDKNSALENEKAALEDKNSALENEKAAWNDERLQLLKIIKELEKNNKS